MATLTDDNEVARKVIKFNGSRLNMLLLSKNINKKQDYISNSIINRIRFAYPGAGFVLKEVKQITKRNRAHNGIPLHRL